MKNRYTIDKSNRLIIKHKRRDLVTPGRFQIDKNNQLLLWLNQPAAWRRLYGLPDKVAFQGNWRLNQDYDLELYRYQTDSRYQADSLVFKGNITSVDKNSLVFKIKTPDKRNQIEYLKLAGLWRADEFNQLSFIVKKKAAPDILVLKGAWRVNQNQQVSYTCEKVRLKRKTRISNNLTFEGFWQINSSNRLTYILSGARESRFDFRAHIQSPNLYPKQGVIKCRLGMGVRQSKEFQRREISLYGTWKFSRKLGLIFQMEYARGKVQGIEFTADICLSKKDKITFALKNKSGEPLGINITFTHKFLRQRNAQAFMRLKKVLKEESAAEAGLRIPF